MIRCFVHGLLFSLAFWCALAVLARAEQTRTTCYRSGSTEICETFDRYGAIISKSRCYRSGADLRCDTENFNRSFK